MTNQDETPPTAVIPATADFDQLAISTPPGEQTSEHKRTVFAQYLGGSVFMTVLGMIITRPDSMPVPVMITALICAAIVTAWPTVWYAGTRKGLKTTIINARATVEKIKASERAKQQQQQQQQQ